MTRWTAGASKAIARFTFQSENRAGRISAHKRKRTMNKALKYAAIGAALVGTAVVSSAAVDTDIAGMVTDATSLFTSAKGVVIAVVGFGIAITYIKLLRKK